MCSVDPDDVAEMVKSIPINLTKSDVCRKCGEGSAQVVLRTNDIYCNACFLVYFVHKFRSTIGKSKQIRPMDKILIGYSGGMNSSAMLHLIRQGFDEDSHKKLRFDPYFIYIDETAIFENGSDIGCCHEVSMQKFPCYYVRLEEVMRSDDITVLTYTKGNQSSYMQSDSDHLISELKELYFTLKSETSQEDLLTHLRNELLCRCANQLGIKKVFLGENGTDLSVRILSDMALGRGSQLPGHVHFKSVHFKREIFRPLRELLANEIEYFIEIQKVYVPSKLKHSEISNSNITLCTTNFVMGLQKDFPATVPTILKTGDKLVSGNLDSSNSVSSKGDSSGQMSVDCSEGGSSKENSCLMCRSIIDTNQGASSALESIKISKRMSMVQAPTKASSLNGETNLNIPGIQDKEDFHNDNNKIYINSVSSQGFDMYKYFCFGCSNLLREMTLLDLLPARIKEELKIRQSEEEALNLIKDCLLK